LAAGSCLEIVGHTSKSGAPAINDTVLNSTRRSIALNGPSISVPTPLLDRQIAGHVLAELVQNLPQKR
jgi:hypothetical protein